METNGLGLPIEATQQVVANLNVLLSNFQVYYQNLRGLHWNIKGKRFFDLHVKFEEFYNDAQIKIDLIAERILTLGGVPLHSFDQYLLHNQLEIGKNISNDVAAMKLVASSVLVLLKIERSILKTAAQIDDEGTTAMMSDFIKEQEKTSWMLKAWLDDVI